MAAIKAIYENGVFRPLRPVKLPDGSPVELIVVQDPQTQPAADSKTTEEIANNTGKEGPLVGEELAALLDEIASLPYTPHPDGRTDIAEHHDEILYPKYGKQP
jgi:predicted DNA-binding antitoxin AbrB/MazE fold protein